MQQANTAHPVQPHRVIIIAGPTASGKSDYALSVARRVGGEIINADSAQMYTKVSVGTAKPADWAASDIPHHLFDICTTPVDYDVTQYRERVIALVAEIQARGKTPILVGGSLFYIKSLVFPPQGIKGDAAAIPRAIQSMATQQAWQHLQSIDPVRAEQIHMHDAYRVMRAIALWYDSGIKPSALVPQFSPPFPFYLVFLSPPVEVLYERINLRTVDMIQNQRWIAEAHELIQDSAWKALVLKKGFIGYAAIMQWIEDGERAELLPELIAHIQQDTRNYAKRQRTFWRSFLRQLESVSTPDQCQIFERQNV
jgi:tRNA dimethylallyltransferase